jgi:diguanylate cyclase (GGDEF)-like protein
MSNYDLQRHRNFDAAVQPVDSRPNRRSLFLLGGWALLIVALFALIVGIDLFDRLYEFTRAHEEWELDELLALLLCVGVTSLVFLAVRTRQLAHEIRRREAAERLAHESARHDPLTGLANGRRFREALAKAIEASRRSHSSCAVLFIDLDRFKPVNDTYGHAVGDEVLIGVARQIVQAAPAGATAARLGGDEFGVIVPEVSGRESVLFLAQRLSRDIRRLRQVDRLQLEVGATVGIGMFPDDGSDADSLIHAADQAMYAAKPSRHALAERGGISGRLIAN